MARIFRVLTVATASLLVIGCSSLLENACTNGFTSPSHPDCQPIVAKKTCAARDWLRRGELLGARGEDPNKDPSILECRAFGVDDARVAEGYKRGLEKYCGENQAYDVGFAGAEFRSRDLCSKEQNEKARQWHAKGAKAYCEPATGKDVGRKGLTPHSKCGAAWEKQYKIGYAIGERERLHAKIDGLLNKQKNLREEYYRLEQKRIDLSERKLRLPRIGEGVADQRQKIELEILDVDREILRIKQEQEQLTTEIAKVKSETSTQ